MILFGYRDNQVFYESVEMSKRVRGKVIGRKLFGLVRIDILCRCSNFRDTLDPSCDRQRTLIVEVRKKGSNRVLFDGKIKRTR